MTIGYRLNIRNVNTVIQTNKTRSLTYHSTWFKKRFANQFDWIKGTGSYEWFVNQTTLADTSCKHRLKQNKQLSVQSGEKAAVKIFYYSGHKQYFYINRPSIIERLCVLIQVSKLWAGNYSYDGVQLQREGGRRSSLRIRGARRNRHPD